MSWYAIGMSWLDFNLFMLALALCVEDFESTATYLPGGAVETTAGATASAGFSVSDIADDVHGSRVHRLSHPNFANDQAGYERNSNESDYAEDQKNTHQNISFSE